MHYLSIKVCAIRTSGWWRLLTEWPRPPRFTKYRPAPRLGIRRVENRLLRELHDQLAQAATPIS
jgi:hypothetical protein